MKQLIFLLPFFFFPEIGSTSLAQRDVICPVDGESLRVYGLLSTNNFGGYSSDLLTYSSDRNPILTYPQTHKNCQYTGHINDFGPEVKLSRSLKERLKEGKFFQKNRFLISLNESNATWQKYDFIAQLYIERKVESDLIYSQYLSAGWASRLESSEEILSFFESSYREKILSSVKDMKVKRDDSLENRFDAEIQKLNELYSKAREVKDKAPLLIYLLSRYKYYGENETVAKILEDLKDSMNPTDYLEFQPIVIGHINREKYYQHKAVDCLEKKVIPENKNSEYKEYFIYMAGELHRRLGNLEKTKSYFDQLDYEKMKGGSPIRHFLKKYKTRSK